MAASRILTVLHDDIVNVFHHMCFQGIQAQEAIRRIGAAPMTLCIHQRHLGNQHQRHLEAWRRAAQTGKDTKQETETETEEIDKETK